MAGDWLKMRCDLWDDPRVVRLSATLAHAAAHGRATVLGALFRTWSLADAYTVDGRLAGYTPEALDVAVGVAGWSHALAQVGWLLVESDAVAVPRFDEHNGQSAKRRAQDSARKGAVRKMSASDADKMRNREEKSREEKNIRLSPDGSSTSPKLRFTDDDRQAADAIWNLVHSLNPNAKPPNLDGWANEIRLMRERDGADRTPANIVALFKWANAHSFWKTNILSPAALRKQWDRLTLQRKEESNGSSNAKRSTDGRYGQSVRSETETPGRRAF